MVRTDRVRAGEAGEVPDPEAPEIMKNHPKFGTSGKDFWRAVSGQGG